MATSFPSLAVCRRKGCWLKVSMGRIEIIQWRFVTLTTPRQCVTRESVLRRGVWWMVEGQAGRSAMDRQEQYSKAGRRKEHAETGRAGEEGVHVSVSESESENEVAPHFGRSEVRLGFPSTVNSGPSRVTIDVSHPWTPPRLGLNLVLCRGVSLGSSSSTLALEISIFCFVSLGEIPSATSL
ncbi:hypothetical protein NM208_g10335 [Fusarium decemcellulare]|uniref:Uncharacterized protein n=1 Tax=Fusarium decemcellulare TaxID=57161 RepID=A0ACC1RY82_9HYPO|nr:hypothetical protein NM208_g10335 [Fusarium decemcellulare]